MPNTLVLVPTDLERRRLAPRLSRHPDGGVEIALCGFGPVVAAARTAGLVAERRPSRVLLAGIAGRIGESLRIGEAYRFSEVACYGIGAGTGAGFQTAGALGWPQWPGDSADESGIGDVITLGSGTSPADLPAGLLVTACAASATADDVAVRRAAFPAAVAEDMEGYGVALACRLAGVALEIVRGISNTAGDRDKARWQIEPALAAAAELTVTILAAPPPEVPR
jgi:futalosine hydrolase